MVPGQGTFSLHFRVSVLFPTQPFPPFAGAGLLHVLVLVWVPWLHDLVHAVHGVHSLHAPSTNKEQVELNLVCQKIQFFEPGEL